MVRGQGDVQRVGEQRDVGEAGVGGAGAPRPRGTGRGRPHRRPAGRTPRRPPPRGPGRSPADASRAGPVRRVLTRAGTAVGKAPTRTSPASPGAYAARAASARSSCSNTGSVCASTSRGRVGEPDPAALRLQQGHAELGGEVGELLGDGGRGRVRGLGRRGDRAPFAQGAQDPQLPPGPTRPCAHATRRAGLVGRGGEPVVGMRGFAQPWQRYLGAPPHRRPHARHASGHRHHGARHEATPPTPPAPPSAAGAPPSTTPARIGARPAVAVLPCVRRAPPGQQGHAHRLEVVDDAGAGGADQGDGLVPGEEGERGEATPTYSRGRTVPGAGRKPPWTARLTALRGQQQDDAGEERGEQEGGAAEFGRPAAQQRAVAGEAAGGGEHPPSPPAGKPAPPPTSSVTPCRPAAGPAVQRALAVRRPAGRTRP